MMYCDIVIISSCYFIFHDWKRVLFGFCVLFIMSIVIDYVINSTRQSVQFLIFSRKYEQIAEGISTKIDRGVTLLDGQGWYSKQDIKVIVVLARKRRITWYLPSGEGYWSWCVYFPKQCSRRVWRRIRQAESKINESKSKYFSKIYLKIE